MEKLNNDTLFEIIKNVSLIDVRHCILVNKLWANTVMEKRTLECIMNDFMTTNEYYDYSDCRYVCMHHRKNKFREGYEQFIANNDDYANMIVQLSTAWNTYIKKYKYCVAKLVKIYYVPETEYCETCDTCDESVCYNKNHRLFFCYDFFNCNTYCGNAFHLSLHA